MARFHAPDSFASRGWRNRSLVVSFGHPTLPGRVFDVGPILASVAVALADSIAQDGTGRGPDRQPLTVHPHAISR